MRSLSTRISLLLGITWGTLCCLLLMVLHAEAPAPSLRASAFVVAAFGLAWLAACTVVHLVLRPLRDLIDAAETHHRSGAIGALRLPDADACGDDIAQLSAHFEAFTQKLADQADALSQVEQGRSEFIAKLSHDVRTPLASMQGYIELLLMRYDSLEPAEARNYLQTAAQQSERLSRLVSDLFELGRLDTGKSEPRLEPFALVELAQDVAQKFSGEASARRINLNLRCDGGGTSVVVDADIAMVERVLDNLVRIALHRTPAGGEVTMEVGTANAAGAPRRVSMGVHGSGIGIAAEDMSDLLERHHRAARIRDAMDDTHGGLRFEISRRLIGLHGSQLTVQIRRDGGTLVSFDLALAQAPGGSVPAPPQTSGLTA